MRYLNCWDNKNFWGAKSGPLTHASAVKRLNISAYRLEYKYWCECNFFSDQTSRKDNGVCLDDEYRVSKWRLKLALDSGYYPKFGSWVVTRINPRIVKIFLSFKIFGSTHNILFLKFRSTFSSRNLL